MIEKILTHLGLDPQPPPKGPAREAGQDFLPIFPWSQAHQHGPRRQAAAGGRRYDVAEIAQPGWPAVHSDMAEAERFRALVTSAHGWQAVVQERD